MAPNESLGYLVVTLCDCAIVRISFFSDYSDVTIPLVRGLVVSKLNKMMKIRLKTVSKLVGVACVASLVVGCGDDPKGAELAGQGGETTDLPADYLPEDEEAAKAAGGNPVAATDLPTLPEVMQNNQPMTDNVAALGELAEDDMGRDVPVVKALNIAAEQFEMNAQMLEQAGMNAPKFTNVFQLVQFGIVKGIPKAPEGKKYAVQDGKVVLLDL